MHAALHWGSDLGGCTVRSVIRFATAFTIALGAMLLGAAPAAVAVHPDTDSPSTSHLAETGAGDRALIGLGIVSGVLLAGGAVAIALTPRRNTEH